MNLLNQENINTLKKDALSVREKIINLAFSSGGGQHLGGGLSMIEIMCYLYGHYLNISPDKVNSEDRDRFILSKGHGVLGFYPILNKYGFISDKLLSTYKKEGSELISHPIKNTQNGIESSNGSLGHGLSYASGISYGLKKRDINAKVVTLIGDGECNEGPIWEAAMSASALRLNDLTCIVDNNKLQSDGATREIIDCSALYDKWSAFGWEVKKIDGHNFEEIDSAFKTKVQGPKLILASTIKGKGIDFMENNNEWHHGRLTESLYLKAMEELNK